MLTKAEAYVARSGTGEAALIEAQLAADMNDLVQIHWAIEGAKLSVDRVLGAAVPVSAGTDAPSLSVLKQRLDQTVAYLETIEPRELEAGLERVIEIPYRGGSKRFSGVQFLLEFAIPNFYFHLTTA